MRYAAIIIALPFSIVMIGMCVATVKSFRAERRMQLLIQRGMQRGEMTVRVSQHLADTGLVEADRTTDAGSRVPGSG